MIETKYVRLVHKVTYKHTKNQCYQFSINLVEKTRQRNVYEDSVKLAKMKLKIIHFNDN